MAVLTPSWHLARVEHKWPPTLAQVEHKWPPTRSATFAFAVVMISTCSVIAQAAFASAVVMISMLVLQIVA